MEVVGDKVEDVLPPECSAANTVYNYGGSTLDALPNGHIIFSNADNSVRVLDPDIKKVKYLTGDPDLRYSNFSANDKNPWVLAIEEDHTNDTPLETQNRIVAIDSDTGRRVRVVQGADFYYPPEFSPDGTRLAWLEWDHPDMPWFGARLYWASFILGEVGKAKLVVGGITAGVVEPRWGPDGTLFFGQETTKYRQLYRLRVGDTDAKQVTLDGLERAEFGDLLLIPGSHSYAPLSDTNLVAIAKFNGVSSLINVDLQNGSWRRIAEDEAVNDFLFDGLVRLDEKSVIGVFGGSLTQPAIHIFSIQGPEQHRLIHNPMAVNVPDEWISRPEIIELSAKGSPSRTVHGFLWMPRNPQYTSEEGVLPPLIIVTHGGPTGRSGPGLRIRTQYFTSRGYAVFFLDYHGSDGYGRAYRQALWGTWGILDAADTAEVADHLVSAGRVRKGAIGCTGLSAGGYNTLQCITRHPDTFAGAVSVSGISDLETFSKTTHKLEWYYTDALALDSMVKSEEDKRQRLRERSALYHLQDVRTPLLILHATDDVVVPMDQAISMNESLSTAGKDVKLIKVENDGHSLGRPASARIWLEEEEKWWRKTLI